MTTKDILDRYEYFSGKLSELIRQAGYAGIAVVWIFKTTDQNIDYIPGGLLLSAIFITISLACDLLHYIAATLVWSIYNWVLEGRETPESKEIVAPRWINWPALLFFWLKLVAMITAYYHLLYFLTGKFLH